MKPEASTDLIISLPTAMTAATFTDDAEFEKLYSQVKEAVDRHVPDLTTKGGRDAIASTAYKVARTKTALVAQGKKLTEGWRDQTKKVNAACNAIEERLDKLRDDVRKPLTDWENAENARIDRHKENLDILLSFITVSPGHSSVDLKAMLETVEGTVVDASWDEFQDRGSFAKTDALAVLDQLIRVAEKREADAAELGRLRAAQAERDRADAERLELEAKEAQRRDYVKRLIAHIKQCALGMIDGKVYPYPILFHELEQKIVIDDYIGDLAGDVEEARQEALKTLQAGFAADQERVKAEQKDAETKAAAEAAERAEREAAERVANAERAAKEAQERADREISAAKAETERKAEAERLRIVAEQEAEAAEQRRRDADKAHRKLVNNNIVTELVECSGITPEQAQAIVGHLVRGLVPNVTLKY